MSVPARPSASLADRFRVQRELGAGGMATVYLAHALGIVHRDIKPEKILLRAGHARAADIGIALTVQQAGGQRPTQTGLSLGTPQYMSPEQAMGDRAVDARTDIYALGAVTYEMFTGEPPFTGATRQAVVARVLTVQPQRLSAVRDTVPAHVEAVVNQALAKLPADRCASAAGFAEALVRAGSSGAGADAMRKPRHGVPAAGVVPRASSLAWFGYGAATALVLALGARGAFGRARGELASPAYRFTIPAPAAAVPVVSPDG